MNKRLLMYAALLAVAFVGWSGSAQADAPTPATDEEIKELIAKAGNAEDYKGQSLLYILDEDDVYVQDSGLATTESCKIIKILTEAGIKAHAVLRMDYDPDTRRVVFKRVRIHRKDGSIEDVPLSTVVTQPTEQYAIYWGGLQHLLPIPRLAVGDTIEIKTSKIGFNIAYLSDSGGLHSMAGAENLLPPMEGHWYEVMLFQTSHPILQKRYSVHMPKDMPVQYEVYNGMLKTSLWFDDDNHVYTFSAEAIEPIKSEPRMVARDDCVPKVVLATVPDWETKSRWFYEVNKDQFEVTPEIQAKVDELTRDLPDMETKIRKLNNWVADNIRYYGTSRGPCEGFTLHTGEETFRDRGGVCKDKAGMLVTMMRALGCEVYPALTMAGSRVERIPADQFNHTVTVQRMDDGSFRILDPTWIPQSREVWSSREALQGLVYGTPEGEDLTLSPYYSPEYNSMKFKTTSQIDADGSLSIEINGELKGYCCTYMRRNMGRHPSPEHKAALERALNIAANAKLLDFSFTDPFDYSEDSKVMLEAEADGYAAGKGEVRMFHLPMMSHPLEKFLIPDFSYSVAKDERQYGMRMRATRGVLYEEKIELPSGWKVTHLPEKKTIKSGSADLTFEAKADGPLITYTFAFDVKNHVIPPEDYPDYKKAIETMNELSKEWVVCTVN